MIIIWILAGLFVLFAFLLVCFVAALLWWCYDLWKQNRGPEDKKN